MTASAHGTRRRAAPRLAVWAFAALAVPGLAAAVPVTVDIEGIDDELRRNARATLSIVDADDPSPDRVRRLHAMAPQQIREAIQPFGYYRAEIDAELIEQNGAFRARYRVDPGPPLRLDQVDVQLLGPGAADPGFRRLAREFPLQRGDRLAHPLYEEGKARLLSYAAENGYLDAETPAAAIVVDLDSYTATIRLHVATGPQYLFGPVTFEQDILEPSLLAGFVPFAEGEPLDLDALLELQENLSAAPYFQRVEVVTHEDLAEDLRVPIEVRLTPARRQRWTVGAGYGSETGARGTLALDLRRINRRGHRGEVDLKLSQIESRFAASYIVPHYPHTHVVTYSLGYSEIDSESTESQTYLAGAGLTRSRGRWRESFALTWRQEDFVVGIDRGTSELLVPEASWSRVIADDRLYPSKGRRVRLLVRGAEENLLADTTFFQGKADGKWVRSLTPRIRLLLRAELGYTETDAFRTLPASLRFFAGGDQSVRGYGYQKLGPRDEAGNVIGGRALVTTTVEVDSLFFEKFGRWGLAAFWDAGDAMRSFELDLKAGAGAGIRWLSPVGLVRADVAWPLDEPRGGPTFHIVLGPDL
ncbi:MAG TPA: autotransporter assembly complex family protein [Thermoanaerobaculia bacterium]|nr:autotransporter assembly complex family protein [Thermoanaerobaculia bacterium]